MEEQIVINKTEKPNSFETGKPGSRWKLYFSDVEDLKAQIEQLRKEEFVIKTKGELNIGEV